MRKNSKPTRVLTLLFALVALFVVVAPRDGLADAAPSCDDKKPCAGGQACCHYVGTLKQCADLKTGIAEFGGVHHCGACDKNCAKYEACVDGQCVKPENDAKHCGDSLTTCKAGELCCSGTCADPKTSKRYCGGCNGSWCTNDAQTCQNGKCAATGCAAGTTGCGDACFDLKTEHDHCGACGHRCRQSESCHAGKCGAPACRKGEKNCFGECTNLREDAANCHRCGHQCPNPLVCVNGHCEL